MKQILVPTDFTAASKFGVDLAVEIANKIKAHVNLLAYNSSENISPANSIDSENNALKINQQYYNAPTNNSIADSDELTVLNFHQNLTNSLSTYFEKNSADFIFIGRSKENDAYQVLTEEISGETALLVKCPVITILKPVNFEQIHDIGIEFPADHILDSENIRFLKQFGNLFSAKFHLLCVIDPAKMNNSDVIKQLFEISERSGLKLFSVNTVYNEDVVEGISFFSKKKNIDMTVIINKEIQHINIDEIICEMTDKTECAVFCQF
jgi:hypothetical protein